MKIDTLISRLQEAYNKPYTNVQIEDIKDWINKNGISEIMLEPIYDLLTENCSYLPRKDKFNEIYNNARGKIGTGETHEQSPTRVIEQYRKKPVEWLIKKCFDIRESQFARSLTGKEISFIVAWESLKDVDINMREVAKRRIIESKPVTDLMDGEN